MSSTKGDRLIRERNSPAFTAEHRVLELFAETCADLATPRETEVLAGLVEGLAN